MMPDPLTPERLEAIRARLAACPSGICPECGMRYSPSGSCAPTCPAGAERREQRRDNNLLAHAPQDIRALLAERDRLDARLGRTLAERDHWRWEAQRSISLRRELADLLGTEDIAEAVARAKGLKAAPLAMREECVRTARRHFAGDALLDALRSVEVQP